MSIVEKAFVHIQTIFDGIRHKQGRQKMMAYDIKINQNSKHSEMAGV